MKTIFKTWQKSTYIEGRFYLKNKGLSKIRGNKDGPINFPVVFVAYGKGIKSGNWHKCSWDMSPENIIKEFFDGIGNEPPHEMYNLFTYWKQLYNISWDDIEKSTERAYDLIYLANKEILTLKNRLYHATL